MQFSINTAKMQAILGRVAKGVGNSKILPITEYLHIELDGGTLVVQATDGVNFIAHLENEVEGTDGSAIVKADMLIKLVTKTTKPTLSFELTDKSLDVKGNGSYKIPLFEAEEFPEYEFPADTKAAKVDTALLKKMFAVNKSSIATEMLMPCLTGYNVGSQCITTDGIKMCINDINVLPEAVLIPQTLADLVGQLTESEVEIRRHENKLLFSTSNIIIFGAQLDGVEEYPDITEVLEFQYTDYVVVSKSELANALDRLSLFVDAFDNSGILLQFDKDSMTVTDQKGNSNEVLTYKERSKYKKTKTVPQVMLNIDYLRDMLNALSESHVNIQFGAELPIKIVEGNVTQILGTMEDAATETEEE